MVDSISKCTPAFLIRSLRIITSGFINRRGEEFIYSILNWNDNPQSALIVGVAVLLEVVVIHMILTLLIKTRNWLGGKWNFSASQDCLDKEFYDIEKSIENISISNSY